SITTAGGISVGGSIFGATQANYLTSITTGTAQASKALVLNSSGNISSINSLSSATINSEAIMNSKITDTNNASIAYPLTIQHLLSSSSPANNSFGVGLKFQMPNSINNTVDYGAIDCLVQQNNSGLQQGQLNFYTSFAGSLVNAMTLSSLTSSTNNILVLNGATSLFSAYRLVCDNILCNSNILISKSIAPNLTITSSATGTQSQLFFTTDNQTWEIGARGSTNVSNPTNFYIYNGQLNLVMSPAGITQFLNTSVSTTSTSNAFQIAGGLYTAKSILNNSYYNCNTINSGATSHSTSTQAICLNDQAIYFRSQNANDTNHGLMYSKQSGWNSGSGWASANLDGPVLYGNQSVIIGNLNNTSTETICATFTGTTTNLFDTVNIASPTINIAKVNINSPTGVGIINDSTHYANIGTDSNGSVVLTATSGGSYSQYYFSYQNSLGLANLPPRSRLDFGNTFSNCIITLYQANSSSGTYQIGCNNSAIEYTSNGSNGHQFYYNSTTTPQALGTNVFSIQGNGNVVSLKNMFAGSGVHAFGYDTTDLISYGPGAHLHYAASKASFFGYDYSAGSYTDMSMGNNNIFIKASNGFVGINNTSPSCPLHVSGTGNQTTAATFGWLSGAGTGIASGFTNRAFSIRCSSGIMCDSGEIDVLSDELWKENILDLNDDLVNKFIRKIKPIQFNYKNSTTLHYGYSAQNILLNNFNVIVGSASTDEALDERKLYNEEGDKIIIPKDTRLIVNPIDIIPILHKALQLSNERMTSLEEQVRSTTLLIKKNEEDIAELRALLDTKANSRRKRT
ncbi:MAG TPA: tail fiber domain-containing protein, partial [Candidatus Pelethenecus sp.]|nr:tail fiber domain-containing protein [Candidatus Pelethenecus sp.]